MTFLFSHLPIGISLENKLYDSLQERITIDSKSDFLYSRYKDDIDNLLFINFSTEFFDKETDRLVQDSLVKFLSKFSKIQEDYHALFLDYDYENPHDNLDFVLEDLRKKLILPISLNMDGKTYYEKESSLNQSTEIIASESSFKNCKTGYTTPLFDPVTNSNRYFKYKLENEKYISVPYLLYESQVRNPSIDTYEMRELLFLLRNKDIVGKERGVLVYQALDILTGRMPIEYLHELVKNKVVFVGLFEDRLSKYGSNIDKFVTPIKSDLSGSLLLANAYLNLIGDIKVQGDNWFILFIINFLIGFVVIFNYRKVNTKRYNAVIILILDLILSIIFFHCLATFLFLGWYIKMPLGFSLLVFQHKYPLYSYFDSFSKK